MTLSAKPVTRRGAFPAAALAGLLLAGCSSGNVGESWQCPLAETGTCDSVAAADPAVPDMNAAGKTVLAEPLWRVRNTGEPSPAAEASCETACDGPFDPFSWLARLFGAETDAGDKTAAPGPIRLLRPGAPPPAVLPAEPDAPEMHASGDDPAGGDLRTDEVVARIWIAPFVDAEGIYREASHVRVVLEPAGWRLGR